MAPDKVEGINYFTIGKDADIDYEEIAISQVGKDASASEIAECKAKLEKLNENKKLEEGDQVFVPLEYAVDEMQANVTTAKDAVADAQTKLSDAQSNLSSALNDVASALSAYNSAMNQSSTKQVKDDKTGEVKTITDESVLAAQKTAKEAYEAALLKQKELKTALETAQADLNTANQNLTNANTSLEAAKEELKNQEDLSKKEQEKIKNDIEAVQKQIEQAQKNANIDQQDIKAESEEAKLAAEQNQKIGDSLGDSPSKDDLEKAMNKTVSSIEYIPASDGKKRQVIKYADKSSSENNQHEAIDKKGNTVKYYGEAQKDRRDNVAFTEDGYVAKKHDEDGYNKSQIYFDENKDALYGGDNKEYQGTKTKYTPKEERKYDYTETETGYSYNEYNNGSIILSNPEEAIIETKIDENGNEVTYIRGAKGLNVSTGSYNEGLNVVVEDSEILSIYTSGTQDNSITVNNSKVIKGENNSQYGIYTDAGNDTITINNTTFEEGTNIATRYGDDIAKFFNSDVTTIATQEGADSIIVENSTVENIEADEDADTVILRNSKAENVDAGENEDGVLLYDNSSIENTKNSEITSYNREIKASKASSYVDINAISEEKGISTEDAETIADNNIEDAKEASASIVEKYFGKGAQVTAEQEIQAAYLNYLEADNEALEEQLKHQNDSDGWIAQGYNAIKEFTKQGISQSYIENAIQEQKEANEELKKAMLGESDKYSSFEEAYKDITGVEYNKENIAGFMQTYSNYQLATTGLNKTNTCEEKLREAESFEDTFNIFKEYFGSEELAFEKINEMFKAECKEGGYFEGFNNVKLVQIPDSQGKMSYNIVATADDYKDGKWQGSPWIGNGQTSYLADNIHHITCPIDEAPSMFKEDTGNDLILNPTNLSHIDSSKYISDSFKNSFEEAMDVSVSELQQQFAEEQLATVGKNTAVQRMLNQYSEDQNGIEKKVSEALSKAGMITMVGGAAVSLFCPPAGVGIMKAGGKIMAAGMFSDEVLGVVDEISSKNCSLENLEQYGKDFITDFALYYSGRAIGQFSGAFGDSMGSFAAQKTGSTIVGNIAKYGSEAVTDGLMSLGADALITGQVDFSSEGFNQLIGIWTGIANSKIEMYSEKVTSEIFEKYPDDPNSAVTEMKNKGFSSKQIKSACENFYSDKAYSEKLAGIDLNDTDVNSNKQVNSSNVHNAAASETNKFNNSDSSSTSTAKNDSTTKKYSDDEKIAKLKEVNYNAESMDTALSLDDEKFDSLLYVIEQGYKSKDGSTRQLTETETTKAAELIKHDSYCDDLDSVINTAVELDDMQYERIINVLSKADADIENAKNYIRDGIYEKVVQAINTGLIEDEACINKIIKDDAKLNNLMELSETGISGNKKIARIAIYLKEDEFGKALEIINNMPEKELSNSKDVLGIQEIAKYEGEKYQKALSRIKNGASPTYVEEYIGYEDSDFSKIVEVKDKIENFSKNNANNIINLEDADYEKLNKILGIMTKSSNNSEDSGNKKTVSEYELNSIINTVKKIDDAAELETIYKIAEELSSGKMSETECDKRMIFYGIANGGIKSDKILELVQAINNQGTTLGENEFDFLICNLSNSQYSPSELLNAYKYFKDAETSDGNSVVTGRNDRMSKADVLKNILNIKAGSVEASNIEMLMTLVEDGVVGEHIFEYLPSEGKLSDYVVSDIDKIYEAYELGIDPQEAFIPTFKNAQEAIAGGNDSISFKGTYKEIDVGDVFQVEGEDYIRIKTADGKSEKLNMTKETYYKLFPPVERFATTQNSIGNCWEITGINSLHCEGDTRVSLLKTISEDGNDIVIKFPNGEYDEIRFKDGKIPDDTNMQYYSQGALGIQMLEYADGKAVQAKMINAAYEKLNELIENEWDPYTKADYEEQLVEFTEFVESHDGNVNVTVGDDYVDWNEYAGEYDSAATANREGGHMDSIYKRLGYKDVSRLNFDDTSHKQRAKDLLKDSKSFEKYVISWGSGGNGVETSINPGLGIVSNHAYTIKPSKINSDGTVATFKLVNPWGVYETELTYEQVLQYCDELGIARKDSYEG